MGISYVAGAAAIGFLILITMVVAGKWNPFIAIVKLTTGKDGRPSTSKFQLILWTFVVIFAYVVLYAMRLQRGDGSAINQIPGTVLLALGVSIGTTTLARGITSSQVARGKVAKKKRDETPDGKARHLLQDDDDEVDLSKIQLLAWTLIAAGIFLIAVGHTVRGLNGLASGDCGKQVRPPTCDVTLPDIDQSLIVLMGLGHAAYLGKKLVSTGTPVLTGISKKTAHPGNRILLTGTSFGAHRDGSAVTFDGDPVEAKIDKWNDKQVTFEVPPDHGGDPWPRSGSDVKVGVIVNGNHGANELDLKVSARPFAAQPAVAQPAVAPTGGEASAGGAGTGG